MPRYLVWLTVGAFAIGTEGYMIAGLLPLVADDLKVSVSLAGQLVTVFAISFALGSPTIAVATSGLDRRLVLLLSMGTFGVANLLAAAAPSYAWLMASRVLLGLAAGTFFPTASGYAAMAVSPSQRGRALALIYSGLTIAIVVGVPIGTALGGRFGWRVPFVGVAILSAIAVVGMEAGLRPVALPPAASLRDRVQLAARRDILSVLALTLIALTAFFSVYTYFAPLVTDIARFDHDSIALLLFGFGVAAAAGNFFGGYAADKWNVKRFLLIMLAAITVDFAALSLCGDLGMPLATARPMVVVSVLLWGFIGWSMPAVQQFRLVSLAGPLAPIALSLNSSAIYFGISLGAGLGSLVIASGSAAALGWVGAACDLAGFILLALASPERRASAVRRPISGAHLAPIDFRSRREPSLNVASPIIVQRDPKSSSLNPPVALRRDGDRARRGGSFDLVRQRKSAVDRRLAQ